MGHRQNIESIRITKITYTFYQLCNIMDFIPITQINTSQHVNDLLKTFAKTGFGSVFVMVYQWDQQESNLRNQIFSLALYLLSYGPVFYFYFQMSLFVDDNLGIKILNYLLGNSTNHHQYDQHPKSNSVLSKN